MINHLIFELTNMLKASWSIFPFGVIIYSIIFIISLRLFVASIKRANFSDITTAFISGTVAFLVIKYAIPLACVGEKMTSFNITSFSIGICGCLSMYFLQKIYEWEEY